MADKSDGSSVSMIVSEEEQEYIPTTISIQPATTSNSKKLKKKDVKGDCKQARCKACLTTFSIHYERKTALKKHTNSEIHKACMKSFGNNILITCTSSSSSVGEAQKVSAMA